MIRRLPPIAATTALVALLASAAGAAADTRLAIYSIRPDGTDRRLVAELDPSITNAVRSLDQRKIVFARYRSNGESTLYVSDLTGASAVQISPSTGTWISPAFSPDSTRIAFSSSTSCGWRCAVNVLYVVNVDGTGLRQVSDRGSGPSWSPDGTRIVYGDHGRVEVVRLRDRRITRLGQGWNPAWAPRGNRIAFIGYRRGYGVPCFVDPDGRNRRCGRGYSATGRLVWSPDGRRVAFQYSPGFMLAVLRADATGLRRFRIPGIPTPLAWSPDSRRLAYTHNFEQQLFVRPVSGPSPVFRVTSGRPAWFGDVRWRAGRISYVSSS